MFKIAMRALGAVEPFEYLPSDAQLALGSAATLGSGGKLAQATATAAPTHMVMGEKTADGLYPALRVLPTTVFETQSSATVAATLVGSKVTLGADAASVTATTDSGVFTIDWTDGAATNSRVRGHFE